MTEMEFELVHTLAQSIIFLLKKDKEWEQVNDIEDAINRCYEEMEEINK